MHRIRIFGPLEPGALASLRPFFETVDTPVGFPCLYCGKLFEEGDQGVVLAQGHAAHKECYLTCGLARVERDRVG